MSNRNMPAPPAAVAAGKEIEADVEARPIVDDPGKADSEAYAKPALAKGILVVATRNGLYRGYRKSAGDQFKIAKESDLGSWMKIVDPEMEKARQVKIAKAKAEAKAAKK